MVPPKRERTGEDESGASAKEILESTLPLVVKAVADAAAAMSQASLSMASLEAEVALLKDKVDGMERTVGQLKKAEAAIAKDKAETSRAWMETFKTVLTPQILTSIVVQTIITVLTALGLWSTLPDGPSIHDPDKEGAQEVRTQP